MRKRVKFWHVIIGDFEEVEGVNKVSQNHPYFQTKTVYVQLLSRIFPVLLFILSLLINSKEQFTFVVYEKRF
jgi:hypothetical protein